MRRTRQRFTWNGMIKCALNGGVLWEVLGDRLYTKLHKWEQITFSPTQVHVWMDTAVPSMHHYTNPTMNQSIYPPIHPLSNHPFICYPTIHSFIQSTSLPAGQPTHHWSNDWPCNRWINTLLNGIIVSTYRHNGQVLFVQFISKVAKLCRVLTWVNSPFSSTYMAATKRKDGVLEKVLSYEFPLHM